MRGEPMAGKWALQPRRQRRYRVGSIHGWVGHMVGRPAVSPRLASPSRLGAHHRAAGRFGLGRSRVGVGQGARLGVVRSCRPVLSNSNVHRSVRFACVLRPDAPFQPQRGGGLAASPMITDQYPPQKRRRHTASQPATPTRFPVGCTRRAVFPGFN